jgi:hypothetical protein
MREQNISSFLLLPAAPAPGPCFWNLRNLWMVYFGCLGRGGDCWKKRHISLLASGPFGSE